MKALTFFIILLLFFPYSWHVDDFSLREDAFHDVSIETWYFEGISQNHSFVLMITYFVGSVTIGYYIYENCNLIKYGRKTFHEFELSSSHPMLSINENKIIEGMIENDTLVYRINFIDGDNGINVIMRNITRGWVMHDDTMWLAVPDMDMEGYVYVDGIVHEVMGRGYHDHNIFRFYSPLISRGYADGKVMLDGISFVWAKILYPLPEKFIVLSFNGTYHIIHNVSIHAKNYVFFKWHFIPSSFEVYGSDEGNEIKAEFSSISVHYIHLPLINYWRYHAAVKGYIVAGGRNHTFSSTEIMEYMRY
ncbi:MAG: hypothetical protein J7K61_02125 [Thermoplasmata archaeon]|nr:hypothetical protein [Thermoplasmata archaeon]